MEDLFKIKQHQYLENQDLINTLDIQITNLELKIKDLKKIPTAIKLTSSESTNNTKNINLLVKKLTDLKKKKNQLISKNKNLWTEIVNKSNRTETLRRNLIEAKETLEYFKKKEEYAFGIPSLEQRIKETQRELNSLTGGVERRANLLRKIDAINRKIVEQKKTLSYFRKSKELSQGIPVLINQIEELEINLQILTLEIQDSSFETKITSFGNLNKKSTSNLKIKDCGGGGDCFFRCIAQAVLGDSNLHTIVRQRITDYYRQNLLFFSPFLVRNRNETPLEYIAAMSQLGVWAEGGAELLAAANLFNIRIFVHINDANNPPTVIQPINLNENTVDVHLLNVNQIHYQLLI